MKKTNRLKMLVLLFMIWSKSSHALVCGALFASPVQISLSFNPGRMMNLATQAFRNNDDDIALDYLAFLLRYDPSDVRAWTLFGRIMLQQDNPQMALRVYQRVLELEGPTLQNNSRVGNALNLVGRHQEALEKAQEILDSNPDDIVAYQIRSAAFEGLGQYQSALNATLEILRRDSDDRRAREDVTRLSRMIYGG